MYNVLALDQASRTSGWAVFSDGELIAHGTFTFTNANVAERLFHIHDKVTELIDKYEIDEIQFEDIQYQANVTNNVATFKILAEVYGVIDELAYRLKIPARAVPPVTWRAILGIPGRTRAAQKKAAQEYVLNTFGIKVPEDEADAICIGQYNKEMAKIS